MAGLDERARREAMAEALEKSGDYRVLRRLRPQRRFAAPDGATRVGLVLDVETTGLDPERDEIIELGMVAFTYGLDGRIFEVLDVFDAFRQPSIPIPPEITKLTGITPDMVQGRMIDASAVARVAAPAALVIAHNAGFDRRFVEKLLPIFSTKPWACSLTEIDWAGEGFEGTKLGYLLAGLGLFHEGHRASEDCEALLQILSRPLPATRELALKRLLDKARLPTYRFWAENAPFAMKDVLKARGYRWNDGTDGRPKAWWRDVSEADEPAERKFLETDIYGYKADFPVRKLTAHDRFSGRV